MLRLNLISRAFSQHAIRTNLVCGGQTSRQSGASSSLLYHRQKRMLNLQEYQSKQILHEHGVQVQRFKVIDNKQEAEAVIYGPQSDGLLTNSSAINENRSRWSGFSEDISQADEFVIKAQVLAGGRGRGYFRESGLTGGVQLTRDRKQALSYVNGMLNSHLVTKQTCENGVLVEKVMIAEAVRLKQEFYFAIVLDRSYDCGPIFVASPTGGMDIEEVAAQSENAVRKFTIPIDTELDFDTARRISVAAFDLSVRDLDVIEQCAREIIKLHTLFLKLDLSQLEINPLGVTSNRKVISVDAKLKFDENALFRHRWLDEIEQMNRNETDKRDYDARQHNLNYIGLDGSIGCLVNGAGLAMATMDIIKLHGGEPANFLDVGGGATTKQVTEAFRILSSDHKVQAILVNIFGGIVRCDVIAEGIVQAAQSLSLSTPIICRLQGTRAEDARALIHGSNMRTHARDDLDEAARLAVEMAQAT